MTYRPMSDPISEIFMQSVDRICARDTAEHAEAFEEIKARGTWWAAGEIRDLRRKVKQLTAASNRKRK